MSDRIQNLFSELEQICEQYKEQVPGRRRAWPKAVKERIEELERHGVSGYEVSKRIPVPYMTIVSWRSKAKNKSAAAPGFLPVKIVDEIRPTTVTVKRRGRKPKQSSTQASTTLTTVTVVAPNGFRIEGMPVEFAMPLLTIATTAR